MTYNLDFINVYNTFLNIFWYGEGQKKSSLTVQSDIYGMINFEH